MRGPKKDGWSVIVRSISWRKNMMEIVLKVGVGRICSVYQSRRRLPRERNLVGMGVGHPDAQSTDSQSLVVVSAPPPNATFLRQLYLSGSSCLLQARTVLLLEDRTRWKDAKCSEDARNPLGKQMRGVDVPEVDRGALNQPGVALTVQVASKTMRSNTYFVSNKSL